MLEAAWVNRSTGGTAVTGANGLYAFTTGSGGATMNATVNGPNSKVDNLAGGEIARSNSGTPANPIDLPFNASGADELAQTRPFTGQTRPTISPRTSSCPQTCRTCQPT
jgi:hypothetical protein